MADVLGSVAIQDLTYTQKRHGQDILISYLNGGVAGSETVTVVERHIRVTIASAASTATQVKAAVEANYEASLLTTITVSGTGSNVQKTVVSASLSGGRAVSSATLSVGSLLFTAATAGTAGNSVKIILTPGATAGSEVVSVANTYEITIQIAEGVSTYAQVKIAYELVGGAVALATVTSNGLALSNKARVSHCPALTALAGGLAAAKSAVILQDLTYDSDVTGTANNGRTITYTTGATAGSEVVTGTTDVSVQIENAVSTATQIKAKVDAYAAFSGVAATGTYTVSSYAPLHLTKASGTITYGSPAVATPAVAATPSGTITFGAPSDNSTVVFTGLPTDGTKTFTRKTAVSAVYATLGLGTLTYTAISPYTGTSGDAITVQYVSDISGNFATVEVTGTAILVHMDDTAVTGTTGNTIKTAVNNDVEAAVLVLVSGTDATVQAVTAVTNLAGGVNAYVLGALEFQTIAQLTALIAALTDLNASDNATVITLTVATAGTAMNSATVTGTSSYVALSLTFASGAAAIAASTITVDTNTFTSVTAAPGALEFSSIAELTTLVTAIAGIDATDNGSIVTVVAATAGTAGNALAMSKTGAGLTLSAALLSGGYDAATVVVNGITLTESNHWTAATTNAATATSLASAITTATATTLCTAAATTNVCTITANAGDASGNTIPLTTSDATNMAKSGATLASGVNGLTCTISGTGSTEQKTVNSAVYASEQTDATTVWIYKDVYKTSALA